MTVAVTVKSEWCKGCYYCINACPKKAISKSGVMNKQGYEYVQVDEDKCISCGICFTVCPDFVFEIS
ncbi:MAG TPA: 4Fe-4S binding protein [Firmicutes bacterium]|nr:4Fe-4S binding protein [Bacillota bacterium]